MARAQQLVTAMVFDDGSEAVWGFAPETVAVFRAELNSGLTTHCDTCTCTLAHAHARLRTQARTHWRMHAHTHAHTRAHAHMHTRRLTRARKIALTHMCACEPYKSSFLILPCRPSQGSACARLLPPLLSLRQAAYMCESGFWVVSEIEGCSGCFPSRSTRKWPITVTRSQGLAVTQFSGISLARGKRPARVLKSESAAQQEPALDPPPVPLVSESTTAELSLGYPLPGPW